MDVEAGGKRRAAVLKPSTADIVGLQSFLRPTSRHWTAKGSPRAEKSVRARKSRRQG